MNFTITYRGKDGALREEAVEAADRAGCVAECRKRGISPTKIAEGGRASTRAADTGGNSKRATARWGAAAVVVAAIAGGVWWWMGREKPQPPAVEEPKTAKPTKPKESAQKVTPKPPPVAKPAEKKEFVH